MLSLPAGFDVRTISDTDIFSSKEVRSIRYGNELFEESIVACSDIAAIDPLAAFRAVDSLHGVIRHAHIIESKFSALFITRDNLKSLLDVAKSKDIVDSFWRPIWNLIRKNSLLLLPKDLGKIERDWTGEDRVTGDFNVYETEFHAVITLTSYIGLGWEQVRELSVIAVAKDAVDSIIDVCDYKPDFKITAISQLRCLQSRGLKGDAVTATVSQLKEGSISQNLLAAISRIARRIDPSCSVYRPSLCMDDGATWAIVQKIYLHLKIGDQEPIQSFLRFSTQQDTQTAGLSHDDFFQLKGRLSVSPHGAVLIYGMGVPNKGTTSPLCVYLVGKSVEVPDQRALAAIIMETFQDHDVYHTTRDSRTTCLTKRKKDAPWNLDPTYGVHFSYGCESFPKWLQELGVPWPKRQGSPRGSSESGNLFARFQRNPWKDNRLEDTSREIRRAMAQQRRNFIQHLMEAEFKVWRLIAQDRYNKGIDCCACCAAVGEIEDQICSQCMSFKTSKDENANYEYPLLIWNELEKSLNLRKESLSSAMGRSEEISEAQVAYTITTPPLSPRTPFKKIKPKSKYGRRPKDPPPHVNENDSNKASSRSGKSKSFSSDPKSLGESDTQPIPPKTTLPSRKRKRVEKSSHI